MTSLDDEVFLPVLDRVRRGAVTVRHDEYRREWHFDGQRQCRFATLSARPSSGEGKRGAVPDGKPLIQ